MTKGFVASISAWQGTKTEHLPLLLHEPTTETASHQARMICDEKWPAEDGWTGHSVVVESMSLDIAFDIFLDVRNGLTEMSSDPNRHEL